MRRLVRSLLLATAVSTFAFGQQALAEAEVVASIKPIHSLVAGVMKGVGTPHLIVKSAGSPHTYSLKPSDAEALEHAKAVFWVGKGIETFLQSSLGKISRNAVIVELSKSHDLTLHKFREGGPWADHDDHGDGDHEKHAEDEDHDHKDDDHEKHAEDEDHGHKDDDHEKHAKDEDHGHKDDDHEKHAEDEDHGHKDDDHEKHAKSEGGDHDDHGHAHGEMDMHLWLDPNNAKAMVAEIVETLSKSDPANAKTYEANGKDLTVRLDALSSDLEATLAPVKSKPFIVFHDAFQYLEKRFGLNAVGSITVSPEVQPGAERLSEIKAKIGELGAVCVFAEPQFDPKLINVVVEGTRSNTAVIDPLGAALADGPDLYFDLMKQTAATLKDCLARSS